MALEDIPEMMVVTEGSRFNHKNPSELIDLTRRPLDLRGRFVVFNIPSVSDYKVVLMEHAFTHECVREGLWKDIAPKFGDYIYAAKRLFSPFTGGGYFRIDDKKIILGGESWDYGKFDKELVVPIVTRFLQKYLPQHTLEFSDNHILFEYPSFLDK